MATTVLFHEKNHTHIRTSNTHTCMHTTLIHYSLYIYENCYIFVHILDYMLNFIIFYFNSLKMRCYAMPPYFVLFHFILFHFDSDHNFELPKMSKFLSNCFDFRVELCKRPLHHFLYAFCLFWEISHVQKVD